MLSRVSHSPLSFSISYQILCKWCSLSSIFVFLLDFGPEHTKTRELVNARACKEIIVFPN